METTIRLLLARQYLVGEMQKDVLFQMKDNLTSLSHHLKMYFHDIKKAEKFCIMDKTIYFCV